MPFYKDYGFLSLVFYPCYFRGWLPHSKRCKKTRRTKITSPPELRLWLHVLPNCKESDAIYFKKEPMGERPVGKYVSTYVPALRATNPLFLDATRKFTNTSLCKYHNDSLSEAGARLIV